jgi:DNA-directed RNA polymerase specialized sigma24 family protein
LNAEILKKVLELLDPDAGQAAVEYGKLHERLTRFFEWNNADDPTALADEALDRLGRRALDDREIRSASSFVLGVARHLLQEERRRQARDAKAKRSWADLSAIPSSTELERMDEALQRSLARMKPDRRNLIEAYYAHSGAEKIKEHQDLAARHQLSLNALRNRVFRLRKELELSVRSYLDRDS